MVIVLAFDWQEWGVSEYNACEVSRKLTWKLCRRNSSSSADRGADDDLGETVRLLDSRHQNALAPLSF
jgi:hypothetical protein